LKAFIFQPNQSLKTKYKFGYMVYLLVLETTFLIFFAQDI